MLTHHHGGSGRRGKYTPRGVESEPRTQRSAVSGPLSTATPLTLLRCVRGSDKCVKSDRARYNTVVSRINVQ
jgi:hypothetical protein